jgi:hypothetical protein
MPGERGVWNPGYGADASSCRLRPVGLSLPSNVLPSVHKGDSHVKVLRSWPDMIGDSTSRLYFLHRTDAVAGQSPQSGKAWLAAEQPHSHLIFLRQHCQRATKKTLRANSVLQYEPSRTQSHSRQSGRHALFLTCKGWSYRVRTPTSPALLQTFQMQAQQIECSQRCLTLLILTAASPPGPTPLHHPLGTINGDIHRACSLPVLLS